MRGHVSYLLLLTLAIGGVTSALPVDAQSISTPAPRVRQHRGFIVLRDKIASGASIRVTYLGGSITQGGTTSPLIGVGPSGPYNYTDYVNLTDGWRPRCNRTLNQELGLYSDQFIEDVNSLGGTGSELAAYRFERDIGATDLLVCEFAVNDNQLLGATGQGIEADRSAFRTWTSVIQQARSYNPNVAIVFVIAPIRDFPTNTSDQAHKYAKTRDLLLRFVNDREMAHIDLIPAFYEYPIPANYDAARLFDGPDTGSNTTHPSPEGHRYFASVVAGRLIELIRNPQSAFQAVEPLPTDLVPYPVAPERLDALQLAALPSATGWQARLNLENWVQYPYHADRLALFPTEPDVELVVPFQGTSISLWWEWWYDAENINGVVELTLDDRPLGIYTRTAAGPTDPLRRFMPLAVGLDPLVMHELRIRILPPPQEEPETRLALHAIFVGH